MHVRRWNGLFLSFEVGRMLRMIGGNELSLEFRDSSFKGMGAGS